MMMDDTTREALLDKVCATLGEQEASMMSGLISENKALEQEAEQLKQHNQVLRLKVDAMARKLFGKSSEKLDPAQLQMVFDALKNQPEDVSKKDPASDSAACDSEAEPAAPAGPQRSPGFQHGGEFHHQHQLAELRRRKRHELLLADGRADDS